MELIPIFQFGKRDCAVMSSTVAVGKKLLTADVLPVVEVAAVLLVDHVLNSPSILYQLMLSRKILLIVI